MARYVGWLASRSTTLYLNHFIISSYYKNIIPCNVRVLRVSGPCRNTTIFLNTGTKFSQSNWLVLIGNLRTRIDVARDNVEVL